MSEAELSFLRRIPVFEDLEPTELSMIDRVTTERRIPRGATVFAEGDPGEGFHFIRSGFIGIILPVHLCLHCLVG